VIGPTGLGLGDDGTLYVAETLTSQIFGGRNALTRSGSAGEGNLVTQGNQLNMPLGLAIATGGHILTVNGGDGKIVETTPAGHQISHRFLDTSGSPAGAGALFGLAVRPGFGGVYYVDDAVNTLRLLH
jgi:sugar lactone lactonase YvrE